MNMNAICTILRIAFLKQYLYILHSKNGSICEDWKIWKKNVNLSKPRPNGKWPEYSTFKFEA